VNNFIRLVISQENEKLYQQMNIFLHLQVFENYNHDPTYPVNLLAIDNSVAGIIHQREFFKIY